jgi:hypothetical protein
VGRGFDKSPEKPENQSQSLRDTLPRTEVQCVQARHQPRIRLPGSLEVVMVY